MQRYARFFKWFVVLLMQMNAGATPAVNFITTYDPTSYTPESDLVFFILSNVRTLYFRKCVFVIHLLIVLPCL
jgi:hypothetical protein